MGDDFPTVMVGSNPFPDKELPGSHPGSSPGKGATEKLTCKYASFKVDEGGNADLEEIMNDCLKGSKLLIQEKWHFTKEGDAIVVIKYFIPEKQVTKPTEHIIKGQRRLKKAMGGG